MKAYVIREWATKKMAEVPNCQGACHEGLDGKARAHALVESHNAFASSGKWYVSEETI